MENPNFPISDVVSSRIVKSNKKLHYKFNSNNEFIAIPVENLNNNLDNTSIFDNILDLLCCDNIRK